jgi:outer membrane protein insertion porin family
MSWAKSFTFLILILLAASTSSAKPIQWQEFPLDLQREVTEKFPSLKTDSPTLEELDKLLRYLMGKGSFEDVQIHENESGLSLQYRTLKTMNRIVFNGMASFDSSDVVQMLQLEQGQKFDPRILNELRERIKSYYFEQGFLNASVDISVSVVSNNLVDLIVRIQEGPPVRVNSIYLVCANKELQARLNRAIRRNVGKIYNPQITANIPKQMNEYFRDNKYLRATVRGPDVHMDNAKTGVDLTYYIERTEQYSVAFDGNFLIPTPRLTSALDLNTLSSANPNILPELMNKIKEFYWKKGHARIEVKGEEKILTPNVRSTLTFHVTEGVPIKIEAIEIQGNLSQPQSYYQDFLSEHSGETIGRGLFHRNDFEQGLKNLLIELQNTGYLKAKLISSRYLYNKTKTKITIAVNLDEGPLTKISQISFRGLKLLKEVDLIKTLDLAAGEALKLNQLEQGIQTLKAYAQDQGFLEFRILNEKETLVKYNDDNTLAELEFVIDEGPLVKVASILIDGNSLTKEYVLRKEVDFKEGDVLTPAKIEESTRRLQKLSLFNSVEIKTLEQRTQIAERTVIIKVSERAPGLFNVGAGVTNEREFTLRGFAGIAYRNLKGTARAVSTRAEINYNVADIQFPELKLTAGYLEPYLFDSRTKGRINFTRAVQVVDYDKRTGTDSYQLDFLLEQNLTSHILFTYDLWNISQLRDFKIDKSLALSRLGKTESVLNLASTGPAVEIDFRDHPFNPTKGTLTRMQLEYSNSFLGNSRSIEYLKTTGSFTHYLPFKAPNPVVFANSFRVGDLVNMSGKDGVPYDKKGFVLGGLSTIRGFEAGTSERFPNDTDLGSSIENPYLLKNRSQFFLIKSELRFPIFGSVGGAFFYDGGLVKVDQIKFKDPYRDAAGFGLRYATPVGPANIEFAWKLDTDKARGESPFRLHISIGTF